MGTKLIHKSSFASVTRIRLYMVYCLLMYDYLLKEINYGGMIPRMKLPSLKLFVNSISEAVDFSDLAAENGSVV